MRIFYMSAITDMTTVYISLRLCTWFCKWPKSVLQHCVSITCLHLANLECTYCTYHVTLLSPKRLGACRRPLQEVSYQTSTFVATACSKRLSNVLVKCGLPTDALFSGLHGGHLWWTIVKIHSHITLLFDVAFLSL
jgi:hypothetical protein